MGELKTVPIRYVRPGPHAMRKVDRCSSDHLLLVKLIREKGFHGAITVRRAEGEWKGDTYYEIVDGLLRFSAAKDAGLTKINVDIVDITDEQMLEHQILRSHHRIETKPMEYARQLKKIIARTPLMTANELAKKLGKSITWLKKMLSLNKIPYYVGIHKLIDEGKIPLSNAYALAKLPQDEQLGWVDRAEHVHPNEFVPMVQQRMRELRDAKHKRVTQEEIDRLNNPQLRQRYFTEEAKQLAVMVQVPADGVFPLTGRRETVDEHGKPYVIVSCDDCDDGCNRCDPHKGPTVDEMVHRSLASKKSMLNSTNISMPKMLELREEIRLMKAFMENTDRFNQIDTLLKARKTLKEYQEFTNSSLGVPWKQEMPASQIHDEEVFIGDSTQLVKGLKELAHAINPCGEITLEDIRSKGDPIGGPSSYELLHGKTKPVFKLQPWMDNMHWINAANAPILRAGWDSVHRSSGRLAYCRGNILVWQHNDRWNINHPTLDIGNSFLWVEEAMKFVEENLA